MPLSNLFSNRPDNLVDSANEADIISYRQNRNTTTSQLPVTGKDKVTGHSESKERIKGAKKDIFDVSFFYQETIKYNGHKKKKTRLYTRE